jgi:hypothetical protein
MEELVKSFLSKFDNLEFVRRENFNIKHFGQNLLASSQINQKVCLPFLFISPFFRALNRQKVQGKSKVFNTVRKKKLKARNR